MWIWCTPDHTNLAFIALVVIGRPAHGPRAPGMSVLRESPAETWSMEVVGTAGADHKGRRAATTTACGTGRRRRFRGDQPRRAAFGTRPAAGTSWRAPQAAPGRPSPGRPGRPRPAQPRPASRARP